MEVHDTLGHDMDRFIRECVHLSTINNRKVIYLCLFAFIFSSNVLVSLQHVLAFVIERKIALGGDAYSRPPIIIKSHHLHVGDIRGAMGEIASYHERD